MRTILSWLAIVAALTFVTPAFAWQYQETGTHSRHGVYHAAEHPRFGEETTYYRHGRHYHVAYGSSGGGKTCAWATSVGLGCGCFAAQQFGIPLDHYGMYGKLNLKRADEWLAFPHVPPAPNTAAVFVHRHVVKVDDVRHGPHGLEVLLHDAWSIHWAPAAGKVYVNPLRSRYAGV